MGAVTGSHGLQDASGDVRVGELRHQGRLRHPEHSGGRVRGLLAQEIQGGHRVRPGPHYAGEPTGDEVRVDRVGRLQSQRFSGVRRIQRPQHQVVGAPVERPVIGGEPLHHVKVAAEQEEQHGPGGQQPIPGGLQRAVEQAVLLGEPG
ncbi:hypothetical protein GCM10027589_44850 [Actinocorallia lasiicapitis]